MNDLMISGHNVKVDDQGMVSLTDMWKASGSANRNRPRFFIENDKTEAFLKALDKRNSVENPKAGFPALRIIKGGTYPGTWANELVAYKYAGWIDPDFEVGAYKVLGRFFSGELIDKKGWKALHDYVIDERFSKTMGSFHGKGLSQRRKDRTELEKRHIQLIEEYQLKLKLDDFI